MRVIVADHTNFPDLWILSRELHEDAVAKYPFAAAGMNERGVLLAYHRIMGWCLDPSNVVLMAYDEAKPAGYMHLQMLPFVGSENSTIASSVGFYIRPEYRAGKATALLYRTARKVLQANRITHVQAVVLTANRETTTLYESHGYEPVATIFQRDIRAVRPEKDHGRELSSQEGQQGHVGGGKDRGTGDLELPERSPVLADSGDHPERPGESAHDDAAGPGCDVPAGGVAGQPGRELLPQ